MLVPLRVHWARVFSIFFLVVADSVDGYREDEGFASLDSQSDSHVSSIRVRKIKRHDQSPADACRGIEEALPDTVIKKNASTMVGDRYVCRTDVEASKCESQHASWTCSLSSTPAPRKTNDEKKDTQSDKTEAEGSAFSSDQNQGNQAASLGGGLRKRDRNSTQSCDCRVDFSCHGIKEALLPADDFGTLLCRPAMPTEGMCTCFGFKECDKSKSENWKCGLDDQENLPRHQPLGPAEGTDDAMRKAGACKCEFNKRQSTIPLNQDEIDDLTSRAMSKIHWQRAETAGGMEVVAKERGNNREVIQVEEKPKDQKQTSRIPEKKVGVIHKENAKEEKGGDAKKRSSDHVVENCVVTSGWPKIGVEQVTAVCLVLLLPFAAMLWLLCVRFDLVDPRNYNRNARTPSEVIGSQNSGRPSEVFLYLITAVVFVQKLNMTVILSSSHVMTASAQNAKPGDPKSLGGISSGLLIAAEPLGGTLGLLFTSVYLMPHPRQVFFMSTVLVFISNLVFFGVYEYGRLEDLIFLRFISGFGESCFFIAQLYAVRTSSAEFRTRVFAVLEFGFAMGMVGGPLLTSVFNARRSLVFVSLMAAALFCIIFLCFPSDDDLGVQEVKAEEMARRCWQLDENLNLEKLIVSCVCWLSAAFRVILRLTWEGSAVLVLSSHFCLGYRFTGYLLGIVAGSYCIMQMVFVHFSQGRDDDHSLIRLFEGVQVFGVLCILQVPQDIVAEEQEIFDPWSITQRVGFFIVASVFIYSGNCLMAAPMNAWSTKSGTRPSCVLFYTNVSVQIGGAVGPILSRIFLSVDPHPNTMFVLLLAIVGVHLALSELAFGTLAHHLAKHSNPALRVSALRVPEIREEPLVPPVQSVANARAEQTR